MTKQNEAIRFDFSQGLLITYPSDRMHYQDVSVTAGVTTESTAIHTVEGVQTDTRATVSNQTCGSIPYSYIQVDQRTSDDDVFGILLAPHALGKTIEDVKWVINTPDFNVLYGWATERNGINTSRSLIYIGDGEQLIDAMYESGLPPTSPVVIMTATAIGLARYPQNSAS